MSVRQWWYELNGGRHGPIGTADLAASLESRHLPPETPVWSVGMTRWIPAGKVSELGGTPDPAPDSPYLARPPTPCKIPASTAWARYFARMFDMLWESLVAGVVAGIVVSLLFTEESFLAPEVFDWLWLGLSLLAALAIDSCLITSFGTTPGKYLLGLSVRRQDGGRLNFAEAMRRSLFAFGRGLGFMIPLLSFLTCLLAYRDLRQDGVSAWDRGRNAVEHRIPGIRRHALFGLAFLALIYFNSLVQGL